MVSGRSDVCRGSRLRFWITGPGWRRGVTSRTKGRSTFLPALMRASVRNWDVNGGDNDPAWPRSPRALPTAGRRHRQTLPCLRPICEQTRRKRRGLLHAELTGPQACYYGEMVEDDYRLLECSWQGSWLALLDHRFTFLVKLSPGRPAPTGTVLNSSLGWKCKGGEKRRDRYWQNKGILVEMEYLPFWSGKTLFG